MGGVTVLSMDRVGFSRDGQPIVQDVSFAVGEGEMIALLGPNGAGKTTILRLLLRLLRPDKGKILLDGRSLAGLRRRDLASRIAYVPQGHAVIFPYKVRDVVALGRLADTMFSPVASAADRAAADAAMGHLAVGHLADRSYAALSGGERQGVLIARALAQGARILVLDEPETGLDYGQQRRLFDLLRHLAAEGYAIVATTHDPLRAARTFARAILLRQGRIMDDGPAVTVLSEQSIATLYDFDA